MRGGKYGKRRKIMEGKEAEVRENDGGVEEAREHEERGNQDRGMRDGEEEQVSGD